MRILATLRNEWRLFRRDLAGMVLLFLMPLGLTIVMALIQDAPFREYRDYVFDVLWVDNDGGALSQKLHDELSAGQFRLIETVNRQKIDSTKLRELVQSGDYKIGIVIPKGISAEVVNSANQVANEIGKSAGAPGRLPVRDTRKLTIAMYFDPVSKQAMKLSLLNAIDKQLTRTQAEMILGRLSARLESLDSTQPVRFNLQEKLQAVGIGEFSTGNEKAARLNTNSVQHNVPAWAIFGLFFIIIPIAGNMIREREEGSLMRIRLVPGSYYSIIAGKLLFYVLLGTGQFYTMLLAGRLLMPLLGLPALYMGHAPLALLVTVGMIALVATAYGLLVGSIFQTPNQALPFGALSIVILSAIGGIWVPVEILPAGLRQLARVSPLFWALDAVNDLFLRSGGLRTVWCTLGILAGFTLAFVVLAGWIEQKRKK
ncbi:MAG: ABC transporter permease [Flavihumibacter sp.]